MAISSFSQTTYPQKLVIGKDTVIAISPIQLKNINVLLNERIMYKEIAIDIKNKIDSVNVKILKMNQLNEDKTKLIELQKNQITDLNRLYSLSERNIGLLKDEIKLQKKKKFKTFIISVTSTALITSTGILLLKN